MNDDRPNVQRRKMASQCGNVVMSQCPDPMSTSTKRNRDQPMHATNERAQVIPAGRRRERARVVGHVIGSSPQEQKSDASNRHVGGVFDIRTDCIQLVLCIGIQGPSGWYDIHGSGLLELHPGRIEDMQAMATTGDEAELLPVCLGRYTLHSLAE